MSPCSLWPWAHRWLPSSWFRAFAGAVTVGLDKCVLLYGFVSRRLQRSSSCQRRLSRCAKRGRQHQRDPSCIQALSGQAHWQGWYDHSATAGHNSNQRPNRPGRALLPNFWHSSAESARPGGKGTQMDDSMLQISSGSCIPPKQLASRLLPYTVP